MIRYLKPTIERRYESADAETNRRKKAAEDICSFLSVSHSDSCGTSLERERYYSACEELLNERDSERILLYLPLQYLAGAPESFRKAYRNAWYRLLDVSDVRENFHLGDCFELDARPDGGLERVIKCVHLTPWLLESGYICMQEIAQILDECRENEVLLQSFKDTWGYIRDREILSREELSLLVSKTAHLPERRKIEPLYVSKKRLEWLAEQDRPVELLTPKARLEGPFSANVEAFLERLEEVQAQLKDTEIVLVGGSSLKGYCTAESDFDVFSLEELEKSNMLNPGNPHATHVYFDMIWLGGKAVDEDCLDSVAKRTMDAYVNSARYANCPNLKRKAIERLESDLIQYRLLHKGFARFTGINRFDVPLVMEGDCPFYVDEFRRIATMIYAKYVWL